MKHETPGRIRPRDVLWMFLLFTVPVTAGILALVAD